MLRWRVKKLGSWRNRDSTRSLVSVPLPPHVATIQAENLNWALNKTYSDSFPSRFRDRNYQSTRIPSSILISNIILNKNTFILSGNETPVSKMNFLSSWGSISRSFWKCAYIIRVEKCFKDQVLCSAYVTIRRYVFKYTLIFHMIYFPNKTMQFLKSY